jgi:hypothetical protein
MSGRIPVKVGLDGSQPARNFVPGSCKLWQPGDSQPVPMRQEDFAVAAGSDAVAALSPAAWFQQGQGITITGAGVSQWDDASGNGRHLKQGTDANRPARQADGSILFDGSSDSLKCDAFALNQPVTIYILGKQVTWTINEYWYDGNAANTMALFQRTTTPNVAIAAGATPGNLAIPVDSYCILTAVFNGASSLLQLNQDTALTGNVGAGNGGGFTLGARGDQAGGVFGHIQAKEVILFNAAHDATNRETVIAYLKRLGGL